jgi:hypothetical protein
LLGQRIIIGMGVLGLVVLPGCYGSTEPATQVGFDSAVLNARGTTDKGPAQTWFVYWAPNLLGGDRTTPKRSLPGNVTGPIAERVTGLERGIRYQFELCGNDLGKEPVCARPREFETLGGDRVVGSATSGTRSVTIDARSGPTGRGPRGEVHGTNSAGSPSTIDGSVFCLVVSANTALVGFSYPVPVGDDLYYDQPAYARIVDSGVAGQDTARVYDTDAVDCSHYVAGEPLFRGDFTVTDAPPPPG